MHKYIPSIPALMFPKIRNLSQNLCQAEIAIFSIEALSIRLEIDLPSDSSVCPISPIVL